MKRMKDLGADLAPMAHRARRCHHGVIATLALLAMPSLSLAGEPSTQTSSLSWTRLAGAESCIDARALEKAVEAQLGRAVFVPAARAGIVIEGTIAPAAAPPGWQAEIRVSGEPGVRKLHSEAATCDAVSENAALVIAVTLDPDAAIATPPPAAPLVATSPLRPPPVLAAREPACPPPSLPAPPPRPVPPPLPVPWRLSLWVGLRLGFGLLPGPAGAVALRAGLGAPGWPVIEIGGSLWSDQRVEGGSMGATLALGLGSVAVCPLVRTAGALRLHACLGVEAGAMRIGGVAIELGRQRQEPVIAAGLSARAQRTLLGPLVAGIDLALLAQTVRPRYYYMDAAQTKRELFQLVPLAATLSGTLGVELP